MNAIQKHGRVKDRDHLNGFRFRECLARGHGPCSGDVIAAHVRLGWLATGMKPHDYWTLPLCVGHHDQQHRTGERTFWIELFNESGTALRDVLRLAGERIYYGG